MPALTRPRRGRIRSRQAEAGIKRVSRKRRGFSTATPGPRQIRDASFGGATGRAPDKVGLQGFEYLIGIDFAHAGIDRRAALVTGDRSGAAQHGNSSAI